MYTEGAHMGAHAYTLKLIHTHTLKFMHDFKHTLSHRHPKIHAHIWARNFTIECVG